MRITPHIVVPDAAAAAEWYAQALGAEERGRVTLPSGTELADAFWGERHGQIRDPFGNRWNLAQPVRDVPPEEIERAAGAIFEASDG